MTISDISDIIFFMKILSIFLILSFFLTGCSQTENVSLTSDDIKPHYGDMYVQAIDAEPVTLNPFFITDSKTSSLQYDIFNTLVLFRRGKVDGDLAKSWEINKIENTVFVHISEKVKAEDIISKFQKNQADFGLVRDIKTNIHWKDNKTEIIEVIYAENVEEEEFLKWENLDENIIFACHKYETVIELRQDVKWHDGRAFTAADVLFTYGIVMNAEIQIPYRASYHTIKSIEAPSRYTVKAEFYQPMLEIMRVWTKSIVPKHILENETDLKSSAFGRMPVGTGPYKFSQWSTGEYLIFDANPEYFEGRPYFEKLVYRIIPDKSQQFLSLMNGQIDSMAFSFDQYKNYADDRNFEERFNIYKVPRYSGYLYIGYNASIEPFNNIYIRRALSHAVNVDELIEGVFFGDARRVSGPYRTDSWAYNPDVPFMEFSIEKAQKLIEEQGYVKNRAGIYEKDGKIISITLKTNSDSKERQHMVRYIKDYWTKLGIKAEFELVDWKNFLNELDTGKFEAALLGWGLPTIPDLYNIWHSSSIPSASNPHGLNSFYYSNKEVDSLIEKVRRTPEIEEAKVMSHKIHEIIAYEQPYTFLCSEDSIFVLDKRFHGVKLEEDGYLTSFLKWFVPEKLVKYKDGFK